jgi:hypothetical protein
MTTHIIILYFVCFGLVVWQFFAFRHEMKLTQQMERHVTQMEDIVWLYKTHEERLKRLERLEGPTVWGA